LKSYAGLEVKKKKAGIRLIVELQILNQANMYPMVITP
jgi:hypothetical protein